MNVQHCRNAGHVSQHMCYLTTIQNVLALMILSWRKITNVYVQMTNWNSTQHVLSAQLTIAASANQLIIVGSAWKHLNSTVISVSVMMILMKSSTTNVYVPPTSPNMTAPVYNVTYNTVLNVTLLIIV